MNALIEIAIDLHLARSRRELIHHATKLYEGIDCKDKTLLDVGCGNGLWGLYAKHLRAKRVVGIEPYDNGLFNRLSYALDDVELIHSTFQDFKTQQFDIILFHNSIHHLNEQACKTLVQDKNSEAEYLKMFGKVYDCLKPNGTLIILDVSNRNLWCDLHLKTNPFVPSINWAGTYRPEVWWGLLRRAGFWNPKIAWIGPVELPLDSWFGQYLLIGQFRLMVTK